MFNDYVKLQIFPLAILIFFPLFSLKTNGYVYHEEDQPSVSQPVIDITKLNGLIIFCVKMSIYVKSASYMGHVFIVRQTLE